MNLLTIYSGPIPDCLGPFGHLNLNEGLIFISIVIASAVIGYRKIKGQPILLVFEGNLKWEETIMTDTDVLIQQKPILSSDYVDRKRLPFSSIKRGIGLIWTLLLFVLMALLQGL